MSVAGGQAFIDELLGGSIWQASGRRIRCVLFYGIMKWQRIIGFARPDEKGIRRFVKKCSRKRFRT